MLSILGQTLQETKINLCREGEKRSLKTEFECTSVFKQKTVRSFKPLEHKLVRCTNVIKVFNNSDMIIETTLSVFDRSKGNEDSETRFIKLWRINKICLEKIEKRANQEFWITRPVQFSLFGCLRRSWEDSTTFLHVIASLYLPSPQWLIIFVDITMNIFKIIKFQFFQTKKKRFIVVFRIIILSETW